MYGAVWPWRNFRKQGHLKFVCMEWNCWTYILQIRTSWLTKVYVEINNYVLEPLEWLEPSKGKRRPNLGTKVRWDVYFLCWLIVLRWQTFRLVPFHLYPKGFYVVVFWNSLFYWRYSCVFSFTPIIMIEDNGDNENQNCNISPFIFTHGTFCGRKA